MNTIIAVISFIMMLLSVVFTPAWNLTYIDPSSLGAFRIGGVVIFGVITTFFAFRATSKY